MDSIHDVIVIGAGPGGSTAAAMLARQGWDVLLLDKAEFPRDKTCGDGLTPRALPTLDRLGALEAVEARACRLSSLSIRAPSERAVDVTIPPMSHAPSYALVVPRLMLDDLLREKAVESGARFTGSAHVRSVENEGSGVTVCADRGKWRARAAIIATGASTALLRTMGVLPRTDRMIVAARAYFEDIRHLEMHFQFRFDGVTLPGYGWVFPLSTTSANIGAGFVPAGSGRAEASPRPGLERFLHSPAMRRLLEGARQSGPMRSYPIRTDFTRSPTFAGRTLLVGEAAGLVNPLTGDGIDFALESGELAAEHVSRMLADGDFTHVRLQAYDRALRARYQRSFEFCERVRRLCLNRTMINLLVPLSARFPGLPTALVNVVLGAEGVPERLTPGRLALGLLRRMRD